MIIGIVGLIGVIGGVIGMVFGGCPFRRSSWGLEKIPGAENLSLGFFRMLWSRVSEAGSFLTFLTRIDLGVFNIFRRGFTILGKWVVNAGRID